MVEKTIRACLVAKQDGIYTTYVFKDLDSENKYIMCTRLPNWDIAEINLREKGFITVQEVGAGEVYYNRKEGKEIKYQHSGIYIIKFIRYNNEIKDEEIIL